jgi:hypothetical protein
MVFRALGGLAIKMIADLGVQNTFGKPPEHAARFGRGNPA